VTTAQDEEKLLRSAALQTVSSVLIARRRAEQRSEFYLTEGERLSHTGSFAWNVDNREYVYWSAELYRTYERDPAEGLPSLLWVQNRVHPEDWERVSEAHERAAHEKTDCECEFRLVVSDQKTKYLRMVAHAIVDDSGNVAEVIGMVLDVTAARHAEENLRQARAELERVSRATTMGELTAAIAHEVNQPIAATVINAGACLRLLSKTTPDLEGARAAAMRGVKDGNRAAEIISRIRLLFKKGAPQRELVDINDIIREMIVLLRGHITRHGITVRTELVTDLPRLMADRVQLQQVMMNLIMNSIEAMNDVGEIRELSIESRRGGNDQIIVSVRDNGVGLPSQEADQMFTPFFTTKAQGTGMGLSISRSIAEAHGGRLWARDETPRGASFHLVLPTKVGM
jgi:C4-dicarboxylate-specific signal transduction histidine kinase